MASAIEIQDRLALAGQDAAASGEVQLQGMGKLNVRLVSLFTEFNVSKDTMASFGNSGIDTVQMLAGIADKREDFRERLEQIFGIKASNNVGQAMEISRLICAFEAAKIRSDIDVRVAAERDSNFLPSKVHMEELTTNRKTLAIVEKSKLPDEVAPSKSYYEYKLEDLKGVFTAEPLTRVCTVVQDKLANLGDPQVGADPTSGFLRVSTKTYTVPYPADADQLRFRLRTMGACWCYLKYKAPHLRALETVSMSLFHDYTEWLFGPEAWGLATRDIHERPISTPNLDHILTLDQALRKEICEHLNSGIDYAKAFELVTEGPMANKIMHTHFYAHLAIRPSTTVTAPGLRSSAAPSKATAPPRVDGEVQLALTERAAKRKRTKAAKKALLDEARAINKRQKQQLSIEDYPRLTGIHQGDGKGKGKNGKNNKGGDKGGGKGAPPQLPPGAKTSIPETQEPICHRFNKNMCNYGAGCKFKHVCWFCFASHPGSECRK